MHGTEGSIAFQDLVSFRVVLILILDLNRIGSTKAPIALHVLHYNAQVLLVEAVDC